MPAYVVILRSPVLVSVTVEADNQIDARELALHMFQDWARSMSVRDLEATRRTDVRV